MVNFEFRYEEFVCLNTEIDSPSNPDEFYLYFLKQFNAANSYSEIGASGINCLATRSEVHANNRVIRGVWEALSNVSVSNGVKKCWK